MPTPRPVVLLEEAVGLLRQLCDQGRAWSTEDLLSVSEVRGRLKVGKDNKDANALLTRTERQQAPGDARWRWGDVLDAMREAAPDPGARPAIPMADLSRRPRQARPG